MRHPIQDIFLLIFLAILLIAADIRMKIQSSKQILASLRAQTVPSDKRRSARITLRQFEKLSQLAETADRNLGWKPSCLRRSLVLLTFSKWFQSPLSFRLGVRKQSDKFEAHAWIEMDGIALENKSPEADYQPLPHLPLHS